jgi:hypothetical protein
MSTKIDWKAEAVKEAAKRSAYLLVIVLLLLLSGLISQFRANLSLYDKTQLILAIAIWLGLIALDLFLFLRSARSFILGLATHGLILAVFCLLTIRGDAAAIKNNVPIYWMLFLLLFTKLIQFMILEHSNVIETRRLATVGFAVTGLVIGNPKSDHPFFYLVLNKNLRGGKGLWVPPGGHFSPQFEDPVEKLRHKVKAEIGVDCKVHYPYGPRELNDRQDLRTEGGEWITPPVFVLKEDLGGLCSHGHLIHLDFLYLCLTDGHITEKKHKYEKSQIQIPLEHCATFTETERAIGNSIDNWYVANRGRKPNTREDLTKDVTWRIFLAAKIFRENLPT